MGDERHGITLRYDVEIRTADGALLAGWLELPTGAHTRAQADEVRRNIFRLDWSDARIEELREARSSVLDEGEQAKDECPPACPTCGSTIQDVVILGHGCYRHMADSWHGLDKGEPTDG